MTLAEKVEQHFSGRPNSYVPSRTLAHLLRLRRPDADRPGRNHAMHWGTGILLGALRGVMAQLGLRGPAASALHTAARLTTDQTLENATGVGSPPWTWPRRELAIDVGHKAVYSFVTGFLADRLITSPTATPDALPPETASSAAENSADPVTADVAGVDPVAVDPSAARASF